MKCGLDVGESAVIRPLQKTHLTVELRADTQTYIHEFSNGVTWCRVT